MAIIAMVSILLLALPASVAVAQDESPTPDHAATLAKSAFAGSFPAGLGGEPWNELTVMTGEASFEESSEEDRVEFDAILQELDATVDQVTVLNAQQFNEDFSEYAFASVLRVDDVDSSRLLELFLPEFANNLEEPATEAGQVSGKDVTIMYDAAAEAFFGVAQPFHFYAIGDTLYIVSAPKSKLAELFDVLP